MTLSIGCWGSDSGNKRPWPWVRVTAVMTIGTIVMSGGGMAVVVAIVDNEGGSSGVMTAVVVSTVIHDP